MAIVSQALLLRSIDYAESDCIVHLLTPQTGRITAIANGARRSTRRFPGTLDFFNLLRVQVERSRRAGAMARLEHARLLHTFVRLRVDPTRFALASYLLELLDRLAPEGGPAPDLERLFDFARAALDAVERAAPDARLRALLELRALAELGVCPELARCVRCRSDLAAGGTVAFHVADGGPLCSRCEAGVESTLRLHPGTLRTLVGALRFDVANLDRLRLGRVGLEEARALLSRFRHFHLGVELRSERFLDGRLAAGAPPAA